MIDRRAHSAPVDAPALVYPVFAVSCGLLGYEISLMRVLLLASWHHFAFLVITAALVGFGASGTALTLFRPWFIRAGGRNLSLLIAATAVSFVLATGAAQLVPVETRIVPALLARTVLEWILYWSLLSAPFFLGATAIGLALVLAGPRLPVVYASNLAGSAAGACLALLAMRVMPPMWLPVLMGAVAVTGLFAKGLRKRAAAWVLAGALAAALLAIFGLPRSVRVDPFKYGRYVEDLAREGRAVLEERAYGPRAVVEVYSGDAFHELAFLSGRRAPPDLLAVTMDGHWAGSVLRVRDQEGAAVVEHTLMAAPYALAPSEPSVLILGEVGGANVWLALRHDAERIHVVQPNEELIELLLGKLRGEGGNVFDMPGVTVIAREPRHYVDHARDRYDLVQIASLESWVVASGGMGGLQQDNLLTVEGLRACLERLEPDGVLFACRAVETLPRDNAKLIATLSESLRTLGAERPDAHFAVVRDFLAVCTMVKRSPWTPGEIANVRRLCNDRDLTPVYFPGVRDDELNYPDELPGPPEESGDWLHHAAMTLLSDDAADFIQKWPFDLRPPTDDRPFFDNFGKLSSVRLFMRTYGDLWLTRTELAFLFVLGAAAIVAISGALLTVIPLGIRRDVRSARGRGAVALYFSAIGLGYLMTEIVFLSRLIHLVGDPVIAGAVAIAAFLFFSGAGSFASRLVDPMRSTAARRLLIALALAGALTLSAAPLAAGVAGSLGLVARIGVSVAWIAPLAFLMGFPMPLALSRLGRAGAPLVPWAWGVNGFASVLAPPLATAIGMGVGFRAAGIIAVMLYAAAGAAYGALPGLSDRPRRDSLPDYHG